jgi:hypothetical protein
LSNINLLGPYSQPSTKIDGPISGKFKATKREFCPKKEGKMVFQKFEGRWEYGLVTSNNF